MSSPRVTVVGAGVFGLTIALRLARRGLYPVVFDPVPLGDNASGVAAGMIAPVFESLLDGGLAHWPLSMAARDLWPDLAGDIGGEALLDRGGTLWTGPAVEMEALATLGAGVGSLQSVTGDQARALQPALAASVQRALFTDDDWRCDAAAMLARLQEAALEAGVEFRAEAWPPARRPDGPVVIAGGFGARSLADLAPELTILTPIKGQLVRLAGGPASGAVVRGPGVYVVPGEAGAIVGASMEIGAADRHVDATTTARLLTAATALVPGLAGAAGRGQAAVRAATPDGLPSVGPSSQPGVWLAVGARRNGWLLAPLVARMVTAYLTGEPPGPFAAVLDPRRFQAAL